MTLELTLVVLLSLYVLMLSLAFYFKERIIFALASLNFLALILVIDDFMIRTICTVIIGFHIIFAFFNGKEEDDL